MRIVSVNAWGGAMCDALVAYLPGADADVVALQEVTRTPGVQGWTRFEDRDRVLPQRANLMADVVAGHHKLGAQPFVRLRTHDRGSADVV